MDKTILTAGLVLVALGAGFLIARSLDNTLHSAFILGGYMWLVVGGLTAGFALKVKRQQEIQMGALR